MGLCNVAKRTHLQLARPRLPVDWSQDSKDQGHAEGVGVFGRCEDHVIRPYRRAKFAEIESHFDPSCAAVDGRHAGKVDW